MPTLTFRCSTAAVAAIVLCLSYVSPASAATITAVQSSAISSDTAATSLARAFSSANTAGSLIIAVAMFDSTLGTGWSCADSLGNVYAVAGFIDDTRHHRAIGICYAAGAKAGANTVTVTFAGSYALRRLMIHEYSGAAALTPLQATASSAGTATVAANSATTPAIVPQQNVELIFGAVADTAGTNTTTAGTGFTKIRATTTNDLFSESQVQSTAASIAATFTFSAAHDYAALVAAFIPVLDVTPPTVSVTVPTAGAFVTSTTTLTAVATDNSLVARVQFLLDGTPLGAPDLTSPYNVSWNSAPAGDGPHQLSAVATDAAGLQTTSVSVPVVVDNSPPSGSVVINAAASLTNKTSSTLTLAATDTLSAVTQMRFSNTGSSYSTAETFAATKTWTLSSGDGTKTVYAQFKDARGLWSAAATDTILLDTTAPTISATSVSSIMTTSAVVAWTTNEAATAQVEYGLNGSFGNLTPVVSALTTAHSVALTGLTSGSAYTYRVRSIDTAGNERVGSSAKFTTTGSDGIAPTTPTGLTATPASTSQINLKWNASTDNVAVTGYIVWRDAVQIATPTALTYSDTGLLPGTTHSYAVAARDAVGNVSAQSAAVAASTQFLPDTTPPTVSMAAPAAGDTVTQVDLAVTATAADLVVAGQTSSGLAGVQFLLDGAPLGGEDTAAPFSTVWNTLLSSNTPHTLGARARDVAGNVATSTITVTVNNPVDLTPPSVPTALTTTAKSGFAVDLSWTASTDNVSVARYQVLRDNAVIATSPTATFSDAGLMPVTSYSYTVTAVDLAGNISDPSMPSVVTTLNAPDTTPPTIPTGLTATATWSTVTLSWGPSTDVTVPAQDTSGMAGYKVFRNGQFVTTVPGTSFADSGRTGLTPYTYAVAAVDVAGNTSDRTPDLPITTLETPPDVVPPGTVTNLTVGPCSAGACTLTWTAPGNDGSVGTATSYDVRYGPLTLTTPANWDAAIHLANEPLPLPGGTTQQVSVAGLAPGTYFFALTASDGTGNVSALSNSPSYVMQVPFTYTVYGDSRSGVCSDNTDHMTIVSKMVAANPAFVMHVGDMITGYANTTNWLQRGGCPNATSTGSLKEILTPITSRTPAPGLPTSFFPTIGNHDDGWGDVWYPDPYKNGACDLFTAGLVRTLVPNHTTQSYFKDKTGRNYPVYTDDTFYTHLCSTTLKDVYSEFFYYSFDYNNSHFVVMRINNDNFDFLASNTSCTAAVQDNYDICYNIHQLHWLQYDLAKAKANPNIKHIFGFLHAPVFSSSYDHFAPTAAAQVSQEFSKVNGDLVFSGHNHVYERTVPIYATAAAPNGVRDDARGTVYAVTGGGGSPEGGFNNAAWFDVTRSGTKHFMTITVDNDHVSVVTTQINGVILDRFDVR